MSPTEICMFSVDHDSIVIQPTVETFIYSAALVIPQDEEAVGKRTILCLKARPTLPGEVICNLISGVTEQAQIYLPLRPGMEYNFSRQGPYPISLVGFKVLGGILPEHLQTSAPDQSAILPQHLLRPAKSSTPHFLIKDRTSPPTLAAVSSHVKIDEIFIRNLSTEGDAVGLGSKVSILYIFRCTISKAIYSSNSSVAGGKPLVISMNDEDIPDGIKDSLLGMRVGAERKVFIPVEIGFGNGGSEYFKIPSNTPFFFEFKLLKIH